MSNFFKRILDKILYKLYKRLLKFEKNDIAKKREKHLNGFQSAGYGVKLNGKNWTFVDIRSIILGNNVHIGDNAYFNAKGGLIIGDNTHISRNVTIYTVSHDYKGRALPYDNREIHKPVSIGRNVWIGMNASIAPGVTIGDGAVIGIGAVVGVDVNPLEVVGNASQKVIAKRDEQHYLSLDESGCFGGVNGRILTSKESLDYLPTYRANRNKPIVFVLGTGRSGSTSIVNILNQNPECKAFHENVMQLVRISTEKAEGKDVTNELDEIFEKKLWNAANNQLIVHSDQRLWNLVPYLVKYFPNAKFIHLKRDPVDCVKSMVARGWYSEEEFENPPHHWAQYRLQADVIGVLEKDVWNSYSQVEKCTWYWNYLTNEIDRQLKELPSEKVLQLQLENINDSFNELADFIGKPGFSFEEEVSNKRFSRNDKRFEEINNDEVKQTILNALDKFKALN